MASTFSPRQLLFKHNRVWYVQQFGPFWNIPPDAHEPKSYRLILHRDTQHQEASCIALMLTEIVVPLSQARALIAATIALVTGRSVVLTCPRDEAEMYQKHLVKNFQLDVSLEVV